MRHTTASPTQQSSSSSRGKPCSHKRGNDDRVLPGMKEMPSQNTPVQGLKVATLPLDLTKSGLLTHAGEILSSGKYHKNKPDGLKNNLW